MLSKYFNDVVDQDGIKNDGVNKLIPNLGSNSKHVFTAGIYNYICYNNWNWLLFKEIWG